jgi:hypothetical protein
MPYYVALAPCLPKLLKILEARVGIEPTHKGFADLSLTTWVPRLAVGAALISPLKRLRDALNAPARLSRKSVSQKGLLERDAWVEPGNSCLATMVSRRADRSYLSDK